MQLSLLITDPKVLDGHTQAQLKLLIDSINRGYPHLKISKNGNKTDLVNRIVATNNLIEACKPKNAVLETVQTDEAFQVQSEASERAETSKRKRVTEKAVFIDLVNKYNYSQLQDYDPGSGKKVLKLSTNGNAQTLRERLQTAGVKLPDSIADYVFNE
jgi:hypothetical protein